MNRFSIRCQRATILSLLAVVILALPILGSTTATGADIHVFSALGAKWVALDTRWGKIENQWIASTKIDLAEPSNRGFTGPEMFAAFCAEILESKPGAPDNTIDATNIFRVDMDILLGPNNQPIHPFPAPIRVEGGKCQVKEGKQVLSPTYVGRLANWRFYGLNIQNDGDTHRLIYTFEPRDGVDADLGDFDFKVACTAMLNDPTIVALKEKFVLQNRSITVTPNTMLVIAKEARAQRGLFVGAFFSTIGGKCVEQKR